MPPAPTTTPRTIVFFPEAAFGPALNCVGIAQALQRAGHRAVFICDKSFKGVFAGYGFDERLVDMSGGKSDDEVAQFWASFIAERQPAFKLSPIDQLPAYVIPVWDAVVDSAINAEPDLRRHLSDLRPDLVAVDNIILFPAIKRAGCPWVRIISCSENEVPDPDIPPHLSGCHEDDQAGFEAFETRFLELIRPVHHRFNEFLASMGHAPYPLGQFFETSPALNLLLYPEPLKFKRRVALDPGRFQYLEGCVRTEAPYAVPEFGPGHAGAPLIYVSFGSLGAADVALYQRMLGLFAKLPYRFLMNVGDYLREYADVPSNVHLAAWYPQPSVVPQVDLFIHHGGNNSFNEALYFGKPALIMPFCWDGLDNAARIHDTGYGDSLPRYSWTDAELASMIARLLADQPLRARLGAIAAHMQSRSGTEKAARLLAGAAERGP
jgi:MGT family glycosyltransferase